MLFVWVEALRPSQQFFSHVGTFSLVEPTPSNEDEVSCSRTLHRSSGEILTHNLVIMCPAFLIQTELMDMQAGHLNKHD